MGNATPGESDQLDFSSGFEKSLWNQHILYKFAREINEEQILENWNIGDLLVDNIFTLLLGNLKRSWSTWQQVQPKCYIRNTPTISDDTLHHSDVVPIDFLLPMRSL